jgi:multimeric flavodoxin WrbA
MKILGISGSPRKDGNTMKLMEEALNAAVEAENFETELVTLADKDIKPCDACRSCRTTKKCHIQDDMATIFEKMIQADGIILASPVYFGSATPQIKAVVDRAGYLAGALGRVFENKVGGPLVVARRAGQNFTFAQLMYFFFITGMIIPGSTYWTVAFGRGKGEVLDDAEGVRTARNFGKKVAWILKKINN